MTALFKILSLNAVLIFMAVTAHAQKNNAHVQYVLNAEGSNQVAMINGSLIDVYFAPDNSKMVFSMMGGSMKMDLRMDTKKEEGILLFDMMGQQKYKTMSKEELKRSDKPSTNKIPDIKYTEEYKEIAGYKCQKALMNVEGQQEPMVIYFTDKIEMPKGFEKYVEKLNMAGVKGFPMEMAINNPAQNLKMTITAQAVNLGKQSKKIFETKVPAGYTELTEQDMRMLGGMGF